MGYIGIAYGYFICHHQKDKVVTMGGECHVETSEHAEAKRGVPTPNDKKADTLGYPLPSIGDQ